MASQQTAELQNTSRILPVVLGVTKSRICQWPARFMNDADAQTNSKTEVVALLVGNSHLRAASLPGLSPFSLAALAVVAAAVVLVLVILSELEIIARLGRSPGGCRLA